MEADLAAAAPEVGDARYVEVALPVPLAQTFTYRIDAARADRLVVGSAVRVPFGRRTLVGVVVGLHERTDVPRLRDVDEVLGDDYVLEPSMLELARKIADYYACSLGEALHLALPPRPGTARRSTSGGDDEESPTPAPELTGAQRAAVDAVLPALREERFESFLLYGVTGSGKTEVYFQLIEDGLRRGRGALILLPEIALTPQTLRRLRRRFPGRVAAYHSRLSHGERCAVWEGARRGEIPVVVGARSAVFLPVRDLGLIVVDEEHEPSYKADDRPRYHGRDVALLRGAEQSVPVVLGSATPSLETYHNAREHKHRLLRLPERVGASGGMPEVRVIDRRREERSGRGPIGPDLAEAVRNAITRGEQAIVFHNRRGFARFLQCRSCGDVIECPRCDISLTYHLGDDRLRCHYCDYSKRRPPRCEACGQEGHDVRGTGTQRVELALESAFPEARVLRLDQDTTTRKDDHRRLLARFGRGEADILVGTQMVAKGLHFPRVTVVGVIDADQGMHFPDFRAHERAFQLLTQVAGRSGRRDPGVVVVQTYDPTHRVLEFVRRHDVDGFLEAEWEQRSALGYPPLRRLAAVIATAPTAERLDRALDLAAEVLRRGLEEGASAEQRVQVLGPARAVLARINRRHRGQLLLKGPLGPTRKRWILDVLEQVRGEFEGGRSVDLVLDVDPLHLL